MKENVKEKGKEKEKERQGERDGTLHRMYEENKEDKNRSDNI